jgi:hypothetical protein
MYIPMTLSHSHLGRIESRVMFLKLTVNMSFLNN